MPLAPPDRHDPIHNKLPPEHLTHICVTHPLLHPRVDVTHSPAGQVAV
jgi:hypothetical protein